MRLAGGLAWLGRHGGALIAIGVFVGLLAPPLASLLRPLLVPAILAPFLIALLRIDWRQLRGRLGRPAATAAALLWLLLISPALVHLALVPLALSEPIHAGLVLMAAAPPLMASGYLARIIHEGRGRRASEAVPDADLGGARGRGSVGFEGGRERSGGTRCPGPQGGSLTARAARSAQLA